MAQSALSGVRALTFDMYGTLLDLEASFSQGLAKFLQAQGCASDAVELVRTWEASYLRESMVDTMLGQGRTSFDILRRACLNQVLSRLGVSHTTEDIEDLLTSKAEVRLFPDVREGLESLRGRYRLAILSNGDLGSLERTVSSLSIPVDEIISAEQAGAYQPHRAVYAAAVERLGVESERILHVAAHPWDIRGAKALDLMGAYINRYNVPFGDTSCQPDLEVTKLTELAGRLGN